MLPVKLFSYIWFKPGLIYVYLQLTGLESRVNQKGFLQNRAPVACLSANPKPIKTPFSSGLQAECFVYQSHTVVDLSYRISLLLSDIPLPEKSQGCTQLFLILPWEFTGSLAGASISIGFQEQNLVTVGVLSQKEIFHRTSWKSQKLGKEEGRKETVFFL